MLRPSSLMLLLLGVVFLHADAGSLRRVPQQYRTIQSAVNAARVGDTILVDDGLYYENLRINKNIVLASRFILDGDSLHILRTVIDGSKPRDKHFGSTILVKGSTDTSCVILGLTIQGGTGMRALIWMDTPVVYWMVGGGICVERSGVRIAHNRIIRNVVRGTETTVSGYGGGIGCFEPNSAQGIPPYVIIEHNAVMLNQAIGPRARYGGICLQGPGVVRHNVVMQNSVRSHTRSAGGGIGLVLGKQYEAIADGNYIRSNSVGVGGGIQVATTRQYFGRAIIVNNIITDNEAHEVGGGIETTEYSSVVIANNTIVGNHAGSHGDGVAVTAGGSVTLMNNIIWKNDQQQVSAWTSIRMLNNLIEGGTVGTNTTDADPLFVPGDSLFHLLPESPATGTGAIDAFLGGEKFIAPATDFFGTSRKTSSLRTTSLGAVEPSLSENAETVLFARREEEGRNSRLRLLFMIRQIAPPQLTPDGEQVVRAGTHDIRLIAHDSVEYQLTQVADEPLFTLPPGTNELECEVNAYGLDGSSGMSKIIQLEGHDERASVFLRNRPYSFQRFTNLSPRTYRLIVSGGDQTGFIDGNNMRRVVIVVQPYWYQRWWAYALLVLIVGGFGAFTFWYEVSRLRREKYHQQQLTQKQIESQEAERKRLASELHDGLGQDLLVVNSELRQLLADSRQASEELQRVAELVQESVEAVREISSNLHPHHIERLGLCAAVEALIEKLSRSSTLRIESACEPVDAAMSKETKLHVYRVIQESLANVVKHAGATVVRVEIRKNHDAIEITIQDNGTGFDTAHWSSAASDRKQNDSARGFGLASLNERARIIGGKLTIESTPERGTTIRLALPANKG